MKIISFLTVSAAAFCFYLTVTVLWSKPRTRSHWLLFASACCAAYWTFFSFFTYNAGTLEELKRWFYISVLGMFVYFPVNLLFVLNFFYPVVFKDFVMGETGWVFVPAAGHILDILWLVYAMGSFVTGIVLMIIRLRKTNLNREKKQMALLISTQTAAMVFITLEFLLHDFLVTLRPATISPVILSVWIIGMVIAVKRYEFLAITPESVSREILNAIDNIVILINEEERITYMNDNALSLFGIPYRKIEQRQMQDFLAEPTESGKLIPAPSAAAALDGGAAVSGGSEPESTPDPGDPGIDCPAIPRPAGDESVTVNLAFYGPGDDPTDLTVKVNRVEDKYGDLLGYLLIGSRKSSDGGLQERLNLTDRETAIVSKVAEGWKNSRIAEDLGISEQTVKNHLAIVYKKLGVSNRVELLNLIST